MDLLERAIYLLVGVGLGFVLGFIVGRLREIKEELDEVIEREKQHTQDHKRDESGEMRFTLGGVALGLVVLLTAWAAFSSQKATNDAADTQDQVVSLALCNQEFLAKTISALNERTTYSSTQANANVELQKSQAAFFSLLLGKPPATEQQRLHAAESYLDDLTNFVKVSEQQASAVSKNPYPTNEELSKCLEDKKSSKEKQNE